jgi:hypothetical protein
MVTVSVFSVEPARLTDLPGYFRHQLVPPLAKHHLLGAA